MDLYKENIVTLTFKDDGRQAEVNTFKSILHKLNNETKRSGFVKNYTPDEIELIRALYDMVNNQPPYTEKPTDIK